MFHARLGAAARRPRETEMLIRFGLALCACWEFRMRFRPERDWRPWKCTTTMRIMCRWIFILVRDRRARRTHGGITNRLSSPRLSLTNLGQLADSPWFLRAVAKALHHKEYALYFTNAGLISTNQLNWKWGLPRISKGLGNICAVTYP